MMWCTFQVGPHFCSVFTGNWYSIPTFSLLLHYLRLLVWHPVDWMLENLCFVIEQLMPSFQTSVLNCTMFNNFKFQVHLHWDYSTCRRVKVCHCACRYQHITLHVYIYAEYVLYINTMGSILGKAMDENFKKNQEFMLASQRAQVCCIDLLCECNLKYLYA